MFKKAFQIIVTFCMLVGAYQAYLLGFAMLANRIVDRPTGEPLFVHPESRTHKEAHRIAMESLGADSFASKRPKIEVYDSERGFYMYAGDYKRLENGKKFEFWPFAVIWMGKDGRTRKTATCARAIVELNEGLNLVRPGAASMHVVEATLENDVVLRDDKGTLADPTDDLTVGPLPYITYTEKTNPPQIMSVANVRLVDRDFEMTGYDLLIELRKRDGVGSAAGFDAKTAILRKNVHITARNAGRGGVLPGLAKGTATGAATPVDLKNDGEMRIDFPPKPRPMNPKLEGPPEQEGPTIATFRRNVVVVRGLTLPDALNCDTLRLTFSSSLRDPDPANPASPSAILGAAVFAPGSNGLSPRLGVSGPLTELALTEANAQGYAVWLRSIAQGTTAKCNELIYKKLAPYAPDQSYLRADVGRQIKIDKVDTDGATPETGKITSVTTVWATDAKIFDDGKGGAASTVVARGPGRIEMRPGQDKPAEQSASWGEELLMRTTLLDPKGPARGGEPAATRRQITLTGEPKLTDHVKEMKLEAKQSIVVSLKPRPKSAADASKPKRAEVAAKGATADPMASGSFQIEWLQARENVRLTSPGKTMIARDALDAPFEEVAAVASAAPAAKPAAAAPVPVAAVASATPGPSPAAKADEAAKEKAKAKAEPAVIVTSNRVWAKIRQGVNGGKSEIAEARLRGAVRFHQDPAADKARGIDVAGEALDLETVADGRMKFKVFDTDPSALRPGGTRLASRDVPNLTSPVATIDTDDYAIKGPIIGLDQSRDFAWVTGPGSFTQLASEGFLSDKGVQDQVKAQGREVAKGKAAGKKVPMVISWTDEMRFHGRATDPEGRPAGKAEFRGGVDARMEEARIVAESLDTYTDRPVALVAPTRPGQPATNGKPAAKSASGDTSLIDRMFTRSSINPEDAAPGVDAPGKPELAFMDARAKKDRKLGEPGVIIVSLRRDPTAATKEMPGGPWIEQQRIEGEQVTYDKRTGDSKVPGKGRVYLWRRSANASARPAMPGGPLPTARRPEARPIANGSRDASKDAPAKTFGPWELTKVEFTDEMSGRFGVGKEDDVVEDRTADFYGSVKIINAVVTGPDKDLDFDGRNKDFKFMTADALRIVDQPPPRGVKDVAARQWLTAEGNARARTNTHALGADLMTFDSEKDLFLAYGKDGREVVITDQAHPGQPGSNARGDAARFNRKTGAAELINPSTITFLDGSTGFRPKADQAPGEAPAKPRNTRAPLRPPSRGNMERKGFGGT